MFGQKVINLIYNGRGYQREKFSLYRILANFLRPRSEPLKKTKTTKVTSRSSSRASRSKSLSPSGRGTTVSRAIISSPAPNSFKHVAHVGVGKDGVFEASNSLDDSWKSMLANLQGYGVSEEIVIRHSNFVEGFWEGVEAIRSIEPEQVTGGASEPTLGPRVAYRPS